MGPPSELTRGEERDWRNRCWFKTATCQDDTRLVRFYVSLCKLLYEKGGQMSARQLRRIELWLETLQSNFGLRGMRVSVDVATVVVLDPTQGRPQSPASLN